MSGKATAEGKRWPVRVLIALGAVLTVLAILAIWAERQLLDEDEWAETSRELIEDEEIQTALGNYIATELFADLDVEAALEERLPPEAKRLAPPIAGALEGAAPTAVERALDLPTLQDAWEEANRRAHSRLIDFVEDKGELVSSEGGTVTLDLRPLVEDLGTRTKIGAEVASRLPPDAGKLVIVEADEIEWAQKGLKILRGLAIVLTLLALGSFAAAIYLAGPRRQITILWCGLGLIAAGVAVLLIRSLAGDELVDALVEMDSSKPAGHSAWSIGTSLMTSIAVTAIVYGALFAVASWLGSPMQSARTVRRALAPTLGERPAVVYGILVAAALIYLALAPTSGLRAWLTVIVLAGLAAWGISALRRQTAAEFPQP